MIVYRRIPRRRATWERVQQLHKTAIWKRENDNSLDLFDLVRYFHTGYGQYGIRLTGGPRCMWRRP